MSEVLQSDRDSSGKFVTGNRGGGRPCRAVERDYMTALSDELPLDAWREIVRRAVADAKAGDAKAREWIARYALGAVPSTFTAIAIRDAVDVTSEAEIRAAADYERQLSDGGSMFQKDALRHAIYRQEADHQREAAAARAEGDRQKREERKAAAARAGDSLP